MKIVWFVCMALLVGWELYMLGSIVFIKGVMKGRRDATADWAPRESFRRIYDVDPPSGNQSYGDIMERQLKFYERLASGESKDLN